MKAVRVIRTILFVVAIIALLVAAAGNFFIVKDAYQNELTVTQIREELENVEYSLPFAAKAEEAETVTEEVPAEEVPAEEAAEEVTEAVAEEPAAEAEAVVTEEEAAKLFEENEYILMLMKASDTSIELPFLNCLMMDEGVNDNYSMNHCVAIFFVTLTLAFILHLIGKKHSAFWGTILMIIGYLLFIAFFAVGQITANNISIFSASLEGNDWELVALAVKAFFLALGIFIGLGYVRSGSRQMRIKHLKARIATLKKRNSAASAQ